jgi:hypothetical protein
MTRRRDCRGYSGELQVHFPEMQVQPPLVVHSVPGSAQPGQAQASLDGLTPPKYPAAAGPPAEVHPMRARVTERTWIGSLIAALLCMSRRSTLVQRDQELSNLGSLIEPLKTGESKGIGARFDGLLGASPL